MSEAAIVTISAGHSYRKLYAAVATYGVLFFALGLILFPIFWMFTSSFKNQQELFARDMTVFPVDWTLENYINVWFHTPFPIYFWNSFFVAAVTTLITVSFAIYAAYAIARIRFRGRFVIGIILLMTQMFPHVTLVLPLFLIVRNLGLFDTHAALIIANVAFALPFAIWMLRGFFVSIPAELEDAAAVDGAGLTTTLHKIIVPLAGPGIAAVAIFTFIRSWNEFLFALVLLQSQMLRTLPLGLASFQEEYNYRWDLMVAGGSIVSLPVLFFFLFMQRFIVQGLLGGALKG